MPRPIDQVTFRLAHRAATKGVVTVEQTYEVHAFRRDRPATGVVDEHVACPTCGEDFAVVVYSLEALRLLRRKRVLQDIAGIAAGPLLILIAVLMSQAALVAAVIVGILGGVAAFVAAVHILITPIFQGANTLKRTDGKALHLPGLHAHRLL